MLSIQRTTSDDFYANIGSPCQAGLQPQSHCPPRGVLAHQPALLFGEPWKTGMLVLEEYSLQHSQACKTQNSSGDVVLAEQLRKGLVLSGTKPSWWSLLPTMSITCSSQAVVTGIHTKTHVLSAACYSFTAWQGQLQGHLWREPPQDHPGIDPTYAARSHGALHGSRPWKQLEGLPVNTLRQKCL